MGDDTQPGRAGTRRHDPQRRERIVAACLDVIAECGVAGVTHRKVAAAADVPLGSMTYHFSGMDELLREAFEVFSTTVAERFESRLAEAADLAEARTAVAAIISNDVFGSQRDLVLTHELYTLAARDPAYRQLTNGWMRRSRTALERHFDPMTARLLDALIEGLTIHEALDTERRDPDIVAKGIERLTKWEAAAGNAPTA
ncbi:transcriptional regulator, TetR family [Tessaracoccus bendigoensis DSM 12906]|uniref:Transcriptional regulator, TetR family n=1 Tax=Tessaracoccus bendigoensis DSM 12906 TaxID=1123357 RepID=A0A1M6IQL2_9ACTN|nr:TetR family transcriptional regulator [Tessaracoccus bendigoensis]SHJ36761.1 transcriptional regulator, TetR family [Tessaracoccus bendigoensis DSM 12906]